MAKVPTKLSKDLIIEAGFGLRISTEMPAEVVFGNVYQSVAKVFSGIRTTHLPMLHVPEFVRKADPNLEYQPHWKLDIGAHSIWVGPRVISFSILAPYIGWNQWYGFITGLLPGFDLQLQDMDRIWLRYVNFIENNLCEIANINISIGLDTLSCQPVNIQTELKEDDTITILRLANNAVVQLPQEQDRKGSVIEIEVGKDIQFCEKFLKHQLGDTLNELHRLGKERFFGLLQDGFLESLGPKYGDE